MMKLFKTDREVKWLRPCQRFAWNGERHSGRARGPRCCRCRGRPWRWWSSAGSCSSSRWTGRSHPPLLYLKQESKFGFIRSIYACMKFLIPFKNESCSLIGNEDGSQKIEVNKQNLRLYWVLNFCWIDRMFKNWTIKNDHPTFAIFAF